VDLVKINIILIHEIRINNLSDKLVDLVATNIILTDSIILIISQTNSWILVKINIILIHEIRINNLSDKLVDLIATNSYSV